MDLRADVGTVNADTRSVDLIFATANADVLRFDWETGKRFYERLSLDPKHVKMDRLSSGAAPLLDSHSSDAISNVLGVVESASLDGKRGLATVRFSKRAEVEPIFQDVLDNIIKNVSIGYRIFKSVETDEKRDGIPVRLSTSWQPYEVSIVPMGADAGARFRKDGVTNPCVIAHSTLITDADRVRRFRLAEAQAFRR